MYFNKSNVVKDKKTVTQILCKQTEWPITFVFPKGIFLSLNILNVFLLKNSSMLKNKFFKLGKRKLFNLEIPYRKLNQLDRKLSFSHYLKKNNMTFILRYTYIY